MKKVLITGSSGLVGSECLEFFHKKNVLMDKILSLFRSKLYN